MDGRWPLGLLEALFLLGPLVVVPLGIRLAGRLRPVGRPLLEARGLGLARLVAAALAAASFFRPHGLGAAALAAPWLAVVAPVGLAGLDGLRRGAWRRAAEAAVEAGRMYLPVGAAWLVLARLTPAPLGYGDPIGLLTAVHFHFAGFAAPLIAAAASRRLAAAPPAILCGVIASPALVAAGFVSGAPGLRLLAVAFAAASYVALALPILFRLPRLRPAGARLLIGVSSLAICAGMALALVYAAGDWLGRAFLDIPRMVALHGLANGVGFVLLGLVGWLGCAGGWGEGAAEATAAERKR